MNALPTFLLGVTLTGALLVGPTFATTVIGDPPGPVPRTSTVEDTTALLHTLQATYVTRCLAPLVGVTMTPYLAKVCGTLELLIEGVRHEHSRLCAAPDPALQGAPPGCPSPSGVTAPWPGQVE